MSADRFISVVIANLEMESMKYCSFVILLRVFYYSIIAMYPTCNYCHLRIGIIYDEVNVTSLLTKHVVLLRNVYDNRHPAIKYELIIILNIYELRERGGRKHN